MEYTSNNCPNAFIKWKSNTSLESVLKKQCHSLAHSLYKSLQIFHSLYNISQNLTLHLLRNGQIFLFLNFKNLAGYVPYFFKNLPCHSLYSHSLYTKMRVQDLLQINIYIIEHNFHFMDHIPRVANNFFIWSFRFDNKVYK